MRTRVALTSNTHCTYNEQHTTNQILSVSGANTKEIGDIVWMGLNDIYVCYDVRDVCPSSAIDFPSFIQRNFKKI